MNRLPGGRRGEKKRGWARRIGGRGGCHKILGHKILGHKRRKAPVKELIGLGMERKGYIYGSLRIKERRESDRTAGVGGIGWAGNAATGNQEHYREWSILGPHSI